VFHVAVPLPPPIHKCPPLVVMDAELFITTAPPFASESDQIMVFRANSVEGAIEEEASIEMSPAAFSVKVRAVVKAGAMAALMLMLLVAWTVRFPVTKAAVISPTFTVTSVQDVRTPALIDQPVDELASLLMVMLPPASRVTKAPETALVAVSQVPVTTQ